MKEKRNKLLAVRITASLYKQLETLADDDRRSISDYVYLLLIDESSKRYADKKPLPKLEKPLLKL